MYESIVALTRELNITGECDLFAGLNTSDHKVIKIAHEVGISIIRQKRVPQGAVVCEATSDWLALCF